MAIRLKDIARELNVSVITVSKALRGNTDISEATRQRVLARVKELEYQPNMMARSLATGHSFIVGLIVPDLLNPFFTELAQSLSHTLRSRSYSLFLTSSDNDPEIERSEIRMMLARGVDALLIASCQETLEGFYNVHNLGTPFVLLDRPFPHLRANFVGTDDFAGGKLATEHLIQIGRKRLAYIGSPDVSAQAERFRGFRIALRDRDLELRQEFVLSNLDLEKCDDTLGYDMMRTLLKRRTRPNGVFCHNDVVAIGAMKATLDAGFSVPDDIAIVGYDNVRYSQYLQVPLTSIDQSTAAMGESAATLVLDLVAKTVEKPKTILLTPSLVVRQSTVGASSADLPGTSGPSLVRRSSGVTKRLGAAKKGALK
jgi:LacI family transcriptional regulator